MARPADSAPLCQAVVTRVMARDPAGVGFAARSDELLLSPVSGSAALPQGNSATTAGHPTGALALFVRSRYCFRESDNSVPSKDIRNNAAADRAKREQAKRGGAEAPPL